MSRVCGKGFVQSGRTGERSTSQIEKKLKVSSNIINPFTCKFKFENFTNEVGN